MEFIDSKFNYEKCEKHIEHLQKCILDNNRHPSINGFCHNNKISEAFINLNGNINSIETETTKTRIKAIKQNKNNEWIRHKQTKSNRMTHFLAEATKVGVKFQEVPEFRTRITIPIPITKENRNQFSDIEISEIFTHQATIELEKLPKWTVFTDGSTQIENKKCGWGAAIVTEMTQTKIKSCIVMGGAVGVVQNYAAELIAILAICEHASAGKQINIFTDSESSIKATYKFSDLTTRKQTRQPARPILKAIHENIQHKRLKLHLEHVKSHQALTNWKFHGNDIADRVAKIASNLNKNIFYWPNLEMGEAFVCMRNAVSNEILINDPRKEIAEILKLKQLENFKNSSQGIDIRSESSLVTLKKWQKETDGSEMESLGLTLWTRLFPTVLNFRKISSKEHLWPVCCVLCHRLHRQ